MFVCVFLHKKLRNEWRCFCACVNYCICGMLLDMSCAIFCWCICLVFCFLALCVPITSLLYFFSAFVYWFFYFLGPIPRLYTFFLLQVFLDVDSWFSTILLVMFCFLLCVGLLTCIILATPTWFVVFVKFFVDFVDRVSDCFFCCKFGLLHQFAYANFAFFMHFFTTVGICAFDMFISKPFAALAYPRLCLLFSLLIFLRAQT